MLNEAKAAKEIRIAGEEFYKGSLPAANHNITSSDIPETFVDGKIISVYEMHDRLALKQELARSFGVTQNKVHVWQW